MRSPAHRANIKGIGAAVPIYCTQLFAADF